MSVRQLVLLPVLLVTVATQVINLQEKQLFTLRLINQHVSDELYERCGEFMKDAGLMIRKSASVYTPLLLIPASGVFSTVSRSTLLEFGRELRSDSLPATGLFWVSNPRPTAASHVF